MSRLNKDFTDTEMSVVQAHGDYWKAIPLASLNPHLRAIWRAWNELNIIWCRDGVPWTRYSGPSSVDATYFKSVIDDLAKTIEFLTGEPPTPWEPR